MAKVVIRIRLGNNFSKKEKHFNSRLEAETYASAYKTSHKYDTAEFMATDTIHFGMTYKATGEVVGINII